MTLNLMVGGSTPLWRTINLFLRMFSVFIKNSVNNYMKNRMLKYNCVNSKRIE